MSENTRRSPSIRVTEKMIQSGQKILDKYGLTPETESWMTPESILLCEIFESMLSASEVECGKPQLDDDNP